MTSENRYMRNFARVVRNFLRLVRASYSLGPSRLYLTVWRTANAKVPSVVLQKSEHGVFSGLENDHLFRLAISEGSNEPHFFGLAKALIKPTDVVLDIGSNMGTHSILLSKLVPHGRVFSFEPQSLLFSILQNNLLLNECRNVTAFKFAISDISHSAISMEPFPSFGHETNLGALRVSLTDAVGDLCVTRALDSFGFDKIDFIKIDVQGSEFKTLIGGEGLIKKTKPFIFIEMEEQHLKALGSSTKELMEKLFSMRYGIYRIETEYPCDHICVPLEKAKDFEEVALKNYSFPISPLIYGQRVNVHFRHQTDQNYLKVEIIL